MTRNSKLTLLVLALCAVSGCAGGLGFSPASTSAPAPVAEALPEAPNTNEAIAQVLAANEVGFELASEDPPAPPRRTLFDFLRGNKADPAEPTPTPSMTDAEIAARGEVAEGAPTPSTTPRLLGGIDKRIPGDTSDDPAPVSAEVAPDIQPSMTDAEIAARSPDREVASTRPRLFGFLRSKKPEPAADDSFELASAPPDSDLREDLPLEDDAPVAEVPFAPVPGSFGFGSVAEACDVKKRNLGKEVARSPGAGTFRLYDTAPGSTEPRVQYITGFKDKCPRKIYAALVLFGTPQVHELRRYLPRNSSPYSASDLAYEKAKSRVCKVGRGKPCPAGKYTRLEKEVGLITAYPSFGSSRVWMNVVAYGKTAVAQVY